MPVAIDEVTAEVEPEPAPPAEHEPEPEPKTPELEQFRREARRLESRAARLRAN